MSVGLLIFILIKRYCHVMNDVRRKGGRMRFLLKSLRAILFQYVFIKLYRVYLPLNFKQSCRTRAF